MLANPMIALSIRQSELLAGSTKRTTHDGTAPSCALSLDLPNDRQRLKPRSPARDIFGCHACHATCHVHERDRRDKSHIWLCHVTLVRYICLAVTAAAGSARRWHGNHGALGLVSQINWTPSTSRVVTSPFACASLRAR